MSDDYPYDDEYLDFDPPKRQPGPTEDELAAVRAMHEKSDACRSMQYALNSWGERIAVWPDGSYGTLKLEEVEPERKFRMCPADTLWLAPAHAQLMTRYQHNRDDVERRYLRDNKPKERSLDQRPYFSDPMPILFHPEAACRRDDRKDEDGIKFKTIWNNRLARLLWMAIGSRYLKSQYFRRSMLNQAYWLRKKPPRTVDDLHLSVESGFSTFSEGLPFYFRAQLYPYIVRILIHEKKWPYFIPPRIPARDLGWVYITPAQHEADKAQKRADERARWMGLNPDRVFRGL